MESETNSNNDLEENLRSRNECDKHTIYHRFKTNPRAENNEKVQFHWMMSELSDNFSTTNDNDVNFR